MMMMMIRAILADLLGLNHLQHLLVGSIPTHLTLAQRDGEDGAVQEEVKDCCAVVDQPEIVSQHNMAARDGIFLLELRTQKVKHVLRLESIVTEGDVEAQDQSEKCTNNLQERNEFGAIADHCDTVKVKH